MPAELLVADSESSTIRGINLETKNSSRNLIGGSENPRNLHAYGDKDGFGKDVKLQHALGVNWVDIPVSKFGIHSSTEGTVLVADTYNNKIKAVDPLYGEAKSILEFELLNEPTDIKTMTIV